MKKKGSCMSNSYGEAVRTCSLLLIGLVFGCTNSSANEGKPVLADSVDDFPKVQLLVHKAADNARLDKLRAEKLAIRRE